MSVCLKLSNECLKKHFINRGSLLSFHTDQQVLKTALYILLGCLWFVFIAYKTSAMNPKSKQQRSIQYNFTPSHSACPDGGGSTENRTTATSYPYPQLNWQEQVQPCYQHTSTFLCGHIPRKKIDFHVDAWQGIAWQQQKAKQQENGKHFDKGVWHVPLQKFMLGITVSV